MQKRTSRLIRGIRQKNQKLLIVLKATLSFYLLVFVFNYLTDPTGAYFSTTKSVHISINALVEDDKEIVEDNETNEIEEESSKPKDDASSDAETGETSPSTTNPVGGENNTPEEQPNEGTEKVEEPSKSPAEQSAPEEKNQAEPIKDSQPEVPVVKETDSSKNEKIQQKNVPPESTPVEPTEPVK